MNKPALLRRVSGPVALNESVVVPRTASPGRPEPAPEDRPDIGEADALELPSGRRISCEEEASGELVTIQGPEGGVELRVLLTEDGPVLRFDAARLELQSAGTIRAECERFEVAARSDVVQEAGGDVSIQARGDLSTRARTTSVTSTRGDVALKANDDVTLDGERVKLNC
jgi:hypothetical protein